MISETEYVVEIQGWASSRLEKARCLVTIGPGEDMFAKMEAGVVAFLHELTKDVARP